MVRNATELRRRLYEAFEAVLRERLEAVAPNQRDALSLRMQDAFALALESTPPREDAIGDMQAHALLATVVEAALGRGSRNDAVAGTDEG